MGYCWYTLLLFVGLGHIFTTHSAKLPSNWGLCHVTDPNFDECVRANIQDAIHSLKEPVPTLGLTSFDPLPISALSIGQGTGPVAVQQNFENVKLHGLVDSIVLSEKSDFVHNILRASSKTPELRLEADYEMNGRVLLLPIFGHGPCNVTLVNLNINHTLVGERYEKKGKTFMRFKSYTITLRPERVIFKFDHLFNGDGPLGREINRVLNENWEPVFADVRDGYEKSLGAVFLDLANRVFTRVPVNEIFLN